LVVRNTIRLGWSLVLLIAATVAAEEQPEVSPAAKLYQQAVIESGRAVAI